MFLNNQRQVRFSRKLNKLNRANSSPNQNQKNKPPRAKTQKNKQMPRAQANCFARRPSGNAFLNARAQTHKINSVALKREKQ